VRPGNPRPWGSPARPARHREVVDRDNSGEFRVVLDHLGIGIEVGGGVELVDVLAGRLFRLGVEGEDAGVAGRLAGVAVQLESGL